MDFDLVKLGLQSGDAAQLGSVARDLGRHLAAHPGGDWLVEFRRVAARARAAASSRDHGFLDALELVATGFQRQLDDAQANEAELRQLTSRAGWVAVLRQIGKGVVRPSDLARHLKVSPSRITKLLHELDDAQLVTQTVEGKERPCRLSPRARVLLRRLPPDTDRADGADATAVAHAMAEVVPAVVACMELLGRDRRVGGDRLRETMQASVTAGRGSSVMALLGSAFTDSSWACLDQDGAWVATEPELQARLQQHLSLACQGQAGTVITRLAELSEHNDLVLRVGGSLLEWEPAVSGLDRITVLREDDLTYATPPSPGARIVYESPALLASDRRRGVLDAQIEGANGRYCFGVTHGPSIPDFAPILVDIPEYTR
jgi:DNA-binding transcriptional ArsR family regulator